MQMNENAKLIIIKIFLTKIRGNHENHLNSQRVYCCTKKKPRLTVKKNFIVRLLQYIEVLQTTHIELVQLIRSSMTIFYKIFHSEWKFLEREYTKTQQLHCYVFLKTGFPHQIFFKIPNYGRHHRNHIHKTFSAGQINLERTNCLIFYFS